MLSINHGDIQPSNVFVDSKEDNQLKVLDNGFLNEFSSGYIRCINDCDYYSPLSPSAMNSLGLRLTNGDFNKPKNDIWAAGITMLCILFNEDFLKYYDWDRYCVRDEVIRERLLTLIKSGFSKRFVKILNGMLELNDMDRYAVNELYNAFE